MFISQTTNPEEKMKNTSLILNIFRGLKALQEKHDDDFESLEKDFTTFMKKAVEQEYSDNTLSKQHDLYQANDEIEEVLSNLMRDAENGSEAYQYLKGTKSKITKLNTLLSEVAPQEFHTLEKTLQTKVLNAVDSLIKSFEQLVEHRSYEDLSNLPLDLNDIYDSFENQKNTLEAGNKTISDLKEILDQISL